METAAELPAAVAASVNEAAAAVLVTVAISVVVEADDVAAVAEVSADMTVVLEE